MIGWLKRLLGRRESTTVDGDDGPVLWHQDAGRTYADAATIDDAVRGLTVVLCWKSGAFVVADPVGRCIKIDGHEYPVAFEQDAEKTRWRASIAWPPA